MSLVTQIFHGVDSLRYMDSSVVRGQTNNLGIDN